MKTLALFSLLAAFYWPDGVAPTSIISGIYPGGDPGGCCWIGASGALRVDVPAGADSVIVTIEVPPQAAVPGGTAITASFDGVPAPRVCCFGIGVYQAAFPLPHRSTRDHTVVMRITPSSHFVPALRHINNDRRTLSTLLRGVAVEDTIGGITYGASASAPVQDRSEILAFLALLIAGALVTFVLVRRRIAYAWIILIAADPFALSVPIAGTTLTLSKVALLAAILALAVERVRIQPLRDRRFLILAGTFVVFIGSMVLSSIHALYHGAAMRETLKAVGYLLTFAVAALAYHDDPDPVLLRRTLAYVTIVVSVLAIPQLHYGSSQSIFLFGHTLMRVAGPLEGPNQLGAFLGIVLPLLLSLVIGDRVRWEELAAFALGGAALVLTFSRAGVVACVVACVLVLLLRLRARGVVLACAVAIWLAIAVTAFQSAAHGDGIFNRIFPARSTDAYNGGLGTRAALWHAAIAMHRSHKLLGVGPGNYELRVSAFAPGVRTHPNNYYLQALSEQGVIGLLAFLLLIGATIYALYARPNALRTGVLAVVIAFSFHQIVDGLLIYPKVGDAYWSVIGIASL